MLQPATKGMGVWNSGNVGQAMLPTCWRSLKTTRRGRAYARWSKSPHNVVCPPGPSTIPVISSPPGRPIRLIFYRWCVLIGRLRTPFIGYWTSLFGRTKAACAKTMHRVILLCFVGSRSTCSNKSLHSRWESKPSGFEQAGMPPICLKCSAHLEYAIALHKWSSDNSDRSIISIICIVA